MSAVLVGATATTVASTVTDLTLAPPAGAIKGDTLIPFMARNNSSALWAEQGSSAFGSALGTPTQAMAAFSRQIDGTEAGSYTFRSSVNSVNFAILVFLLYRNVGPVANVSYTHQAASATIALGSVTGVNRGLLSGVVVSPVNGTGTSYTGTPGTMTEHFDNIVAPQNCNAMEANELLSASGATGTRTFTRSASSNQKGLLIAFNQGVVVTRWNGSAEVPVTITRWNGSAEVPVALKRWNGSAETP